MMEDFHTTCTATSGRIWDFKEESGNTFPQKLLYTFQQKAENRISAGEKKPKPTTKQLHTKKPKETNKKTPQKPNPPNSKLIPFRVCAPIRL